MAVGLLLLLLRGVAVPLQGHQGMPQAHEGCCKLW
jgi:hypothetical protein